MKTSKEMADSVFSKIDIYREQQKKRKKTVTGVITAAVCIGLCGVLSAGVVSRMSMGSKASDSTEMNFAAAMNSEDFPEGDAERASQVAESGTNLKGIFDGENSTARSLQESIDESGNEGLMEESADSKAVTSFSANTTADIAAVKSFSEKKLTEKYGECLLGIRTYTYLNRSPDVRTNLSKGSFLGTGKCSGFDMYTDETKTVSVNVYSLSGISPDLAVGIEFSGTDGLYPYVNCDYTPSTLGQFMKDINFDETVTFSETRYEVNGKHKTYSVGKEDIKKYLLDENAGYAGDDYGQAYPYIRTGISCKVLGIENMTFFVFDDGRVGTNMLNGCLRLFSIGPDKVENFKESAF